MFRVYIGCFGSGLGHATRMLEVADLLSRKGGEVQFSSSNEVQRLIESRGYPCNHLPLADVMYSEDGSFSLKQTMLAAPVIIGRTYHQVYLEARNITRFRPSVVLSDSALATMIAAKIARVPVFTVLNQLSLTSSHGPVGAPARLLSVGMSEAMGKLWELSDGVLLPDLPPPFTISESNLWGSSVSKTRYIGFLQMTGSSEPDAAQERFVSDRRKKVFWQISGPPKTRGPFLERALEVAESLSEELVFVVSGGDPSGSQVAQQIPGGWYYGWCRAPERYFSSCDVIVSRAGHGTIGQAILSSKPSLLVPIPRQPEQEGNALKAEKLGVAIRVGQDDLTVTKAKEAMAELLNGRVADKIVRLGEFASRFDAANEVVNILASAAN